MTTARLTWVDGLQFIAYAGSKHGIVVDTSVQDGGFGVGTGPMEMVLEALAGCSAMDVVSILLKKRQQLTGFWIEVQGKRAGNPPRVFTQIQMKYNVEGNGIAEKAVHDAIALSHDKYCSVYAMLAQSVAITHTVEIRQKV